MNDDQKKSLDEQIKKAGLQKIKEETRKTAMERQEMERLRKLPWYRPHHPFRALIQAVVAGVLAVPLIWFYIKDIAIPLSRRENIRLTKESIATRDSLDNVKRQIEVTKNSLNLVDKQLSRSRENLAALQDSLFFVRTQFMTVNDSLNIIRQKLIDKERNLLTKISNFQANVKRLSQQLNLTTQQKNKFEQTAQQLEKERQDQKETIANLSAELEEATITTLLAEPDKETVKSKNAGTDKNAVNAPHFRSTPDLSLSAESVAAMLRKQGFYCNCSQSWGYWQGKGIENDFERQSNSKVVFDAATGLYWQQGGSLDFVVDDADAKKYIAALNRDRFAGYNNWRFPTLEEAMSLMEPKKNTKNNRYFDLIFDKKQYRFWTADNFNSAHVWVVNFFLGKCARRRVVDDDAIYVRAVRSGR